MKRVKLTVAYDGTNYCGWQVQPNGVSIAGTLNQHLSELLNEEIYVLGASRTDAGVHALGNVAVFNTEARMPAERISYALNTRLPEDIRIQDSREVAPDFHPRFARTRKTYEYKIWNWRFSEPCSRLYSLFYHWSLDVERMRRAAAYLVGTHDFTSFCTNKPEVTNRVRTIYSLEIYAQGEAMEYGIGMITVRICGNGFLYNMVRIIVGTLLKVGGGMMEPEEVQTILEARDRSLAGDTAQAHGLTLVGVDYL
ncbi:MAG: tRNA pseudouridine(38-40) synthase TruA [Lachnospiraceae bacterium]|nr:tRNA pseudouridine(38-40) synthase TruA [Lachnospiraceae bacterium]